MKRVIALLLIIISVFLFVGCKSDAPALTSGVYYAVGDYEENFTPNFWIDTDNKRFGLCAGDVVSFGNYGTYTMSDGVIIATSPSTIFKFEIVDKKTLVLIDNGDHDTLNIAPIGTQFVFSDGLK